MRTAVILLAVAGQLLLHQPVFGQDEIDLADLSKDRIEEPLEEVLATADAISEIAVSVEDASKMAIEMPLERLVADTAANEADNVDNPYTQPGLVEWHADLETARLASKESGRPVMVFHLMGPLDQRFT